MRYHSVLPSIDYELKYHNLTESIGKRSYSFNVQSNDYSPTSYQTKLKPLPILDSLPN